MEITTRDIIKLFRARFPKSYTLRHVETFGVNTIPIGITANYTFGVKMGSKILSAHANVNYEQQHVSLLFPTEEYTCSYKELGEIEL